MVPVGGLVVRFYTCVEGLLITVSSFAAKNGVEKKLILVGILTLENYVCGLHICTVHMFVTRINRKRLFSKHANALKPQHAAPERNTKKKAEGNLKSNEGGSTNIRPKYHYQYPSGNPMKEHTQSIGTAHSSLSRRRLEIWGRGRPYFTLWSRCAYLRTTQTHTWHPHQWALLRCTRAHTYMYTVCV